jgi:hypothetical protein
MNLGHVTAVAVGIAVACGATVSLAQYGSRGAEEAAQAAPGATDAPASPAPPAAGGGAAGPIGDMGAVLTAGLLETPGCLGVETAGTGSGKNVIFAFFKDKQAALAWYHSPTHTRFRKMMPVTNEGHVPMAHVPDGVPVMALASISFQGEPALKDSPIPFSEISIELYTPLTGGLNVGGGFSPDSFRALVKEPE